MKKILTTVLLSTFLVTATFAQKTEQVVSEKVTITFPNKPEKEANPNGGTVYSAKNADSIKFMAMTLDLSAMGLTEEAIVGMGDGLFEQIKSGMLGQFGGATISKDEKVSFKGKSSMYLEVDGSTSTSPNMKGKKIFMYIFFIGTTMHQVGFYSPKPNATAADAKEFFDGVKIS